MKKLTMIVACLAFGFSTMAQTLNVQSAAQDMKKGYLDKAMKEIDAACEHESTKNDAKTWYYAGLIYSQIGADISTNKKSKFNKLADDPTSVYHTWLEKALNAAMRCKELDTDNEYADRNNSVLRYVGNEYYTRAVSAYNENNDFEKAIQLCEESIKVFNASGDRKFAMDAYYLAGLSSKNLKNNENVLKYFKPLVRTKTDKQVVYRTLFDLYKEQKDTVEAMKLAKTYAKNCPTDYNSSLMMAEAYLLTGNVENGREEINKAINLSKDNPAVYEGLLSAAAGILVETQDYDGAKAKYEESLSLRPNQFEANFGLGSMIYNRGVDKLDAANAVPIDDESGLSEKLNEESKEFFRQSIQYFNAAITYIDGLDAEAQKMQRANLYNCLNALKNIYVRLEMYEDLKPINARISQIQAQANSNN